MFMKINDELKIYWLAFSDKDIKNICASKLYKGQVVITDLHASDYPNLNIFNAHHQDINHYKAYHRVNELFANLSKEYGTEIGGFSNNFYTCSFSIILKFISSIQRVREDSSDSVIMFPMKYLFSSSGPNYFLSEYESHSRGMVMYDRSCVLTSVLSSYCKQNNINYSYLAKGASYQKIYNVVRALSVFAAKLFIDLKSSLVFRRQCTGGNKHRCADILFFCRSFEQAKFIATRILDNQYTQLVICANGFSSKYSEAIKLKMLNKLENCNAFSPSHLRPGKVLRLYLSLLIKSIFMKPIQFELLEGFSVNVSQSVREVLVMLPEVKLYNSKLKKFLASVEIKKYVTFTTELKSPHAYVESLVSRAFGYKNVQLMGCDTDNLTLPNPIVGDLFIPNSKAKFKALSKVWQSQKEKIFYPGFCALEGQKNTRPKYLFCYFSSYDKPSINIEVLELLNIFSEEMKIKCLVKLHPRDSLKNYTQYKQSSLDFNLNGLSQSELFSEFRYAIVGESAICFDLLQANKPFIFLGNYIPQQHALKKYPVVNSTLAYIDYKYKATACDINSLRSLLILPDKIEDEFRMLFQRLVTKDDAAISSIEFIQLIISKLDLRTNMELNSV